MKVQLLTALVAGACALAAVPAHALVITPTSPTPYATTDTNSAVNTWAQIESVFGIDFEQNLTEYYKVNVEGGEEASTYADSYTTTFSNTATDPADALIEYVSGTPIPCPTCFLLVKDGNHQPAQYLFDLGSWDGMEDISLEGFWPNGGAISHIAIWGYDEGTIEEAPEPGSLALLGLGLAGLAALRRRRG